MANGSTLESMTIFGKLYPRDFIVAQSPFIRDIRFLDEQTMENDR